MSYHQTIALDAMGGDFGPEVVVPAAAIALGRLKGQARFIFFGDEARITPLIARHPALEKAASIHHTTKVIANDEKPSAALRSGKDSSMRLAIDAVKNGEAGSVVSAGNTGALMAMAKLVLKCLPGINRPAIASVFPTMGQDTVMLDLGANITCDAEILVQFAVLGAVYARVVRGLSGPTVGLLNVGAEAMKGPDQVRAAAAILENIEFPGRYIGFVEGDDVTNGSVDVVVTDGFTGNIALKVAEGVGQLMTHILRQEFKASLPAQAGALLARGALKNMKNRMDPRLYNGGMFLGLDGICVKSHGGMDETGFAQAIMVAAHLVERGYNKRVAHEIEQLMGQESFVSGVAGQAAGN